MDDINPSARRHLLVITKDHVANTDSLTHADLSLGAVGVRWMALGFAFDSAAPFVGNGVVSV